MDMRPCAKSGCDRAVVNPNMHFCSREHAPYAHLSPKRIQAEGTGSCGPDLAKDAPKYKAKYEKTQGWPEEPEVECQERDDMDTETNTEITQADRMRELRKKAMEKTYSKAPEEFSMTIGQAIKTFELTKANIKTLVRNEKIKCWNTSPTSARYNPEQIAKALGYADLEEFLLASSQEAEAEKLTEQEDDAECYEEVEGDSEEAGDEEGEDIDSVEYTEGEEEEEAEEEPEEEEEEEKTYEWGEVGNKNISVSFTIPGSVLRDLSIATVGTCMGLALTALGSIYVYMYVCGALPQ